VDDTLAIQILHFLLSEPKSCIESIVLDPNDKKMKNQSSTAATARGALPEAPRLRTERKHWAEQYVLLYGIPRQRFKRNQKDQ
jgi:hypothetical protein